MEGSPYSVANLSKKIRIYDVAEKNGKIYFWCRLKDEQKCIAILTDMCYNFSVVDRKGFLPSVRKIMLRYGLIVGILFSVVVCSLYPSFLTDIKINESEYATSVLSILSKHGIKKYSFAFDVDSKSIEREILALDGVSFADVVKEGTTIKVSIVKEQPKPDYFPLVGESVRAVKKAVFSRAIVYGGTLVKSYGDIINPGDTLIENYIVVGEEKVPTQAGGEVYGFLYYEAEWYFEYIDNVRLEEYKKTVLIFALSQIKEEASIISVDYEINGNSIKAMVTTEERIDDFKSVYFK